MKYGILAWHHNKAMFYVLGQKGPPGASSNWIVRPAVRPTDLKVRYFKFEWTDPNLDCSVIERQVKNIAPWIFKKQNILSPGLWPAILLNKLLISVRNQPCQQIQQVKSRATIIQLYVKAHGSAGGLKKLNLLSYFPTPDIS